MPTAEVRFSEAEFVSLLRKGAVVTVTTGVVGDGADIKVLGAKWKQTPRQVRLLIESPDVTNGQVIDFAGTVGAPVAAGAGPDGTENVHPAAVATIALADLALCLEQGKRSTADADDALPAAGAILIRGIKYRTNEQLVEMEYANAGAVADSVTAVTLVVSTPVG